MLCVLVTVAVLSATAPSARIPEDVLARIPKDLGLEAADVECIRLAGGLQKVLTAEPINLGPARGLVVHGTGSCLSGNYNAPLLLYVPWRGSWRLFINENGETIQTLGSKTAGWLDLVVSTDASGMKTSKTTYKFQQSRYEPAACVELDYSGDNMHPRRSACKFGLR